MTDTDYLRGITLLSLHMHSCNHERGPGDPTAEPLVETQGQLQPTRIEDGQLGYLVSLSYKIVNADSEESIASGEVAYAATYSLADDLELTNEQVEQFGFRGALFQVHPFLREHLATMCQRSGLTAYPLPILLHDLADEDATDTEPVDGM